MQVPIDEFLSEHDFDGEFAALPPTADPTADLARARGFRRTRRRRRTVAAGVVVAALAATGVALWSAPGPQQAVPASPTPKSSVSSGQPRSASCTGQVRIVGPAGQSVVLTPTSSPSIQLRLGDVVRLEASGPCGSVVHFSYEPDMRLQLVDDHTAKAVRVGTTRLSAGHGICDEITPPPPSSCAGPYKPDGQATVVIRSS